MLRISIEASSVGDEVNAIDTAWPVADNAPSASHNTIDKPIISG
jgi:hypothetical protein